MSTSSATDRLLPSNLDAERAILGGILLEQTHLFAASEILSPEDFYLEANRKIFKAIQSLQKAESGIDFITLKAELQRSGSLEACGGVPYISTLTDGIPRALNVGHYAQLVKQAAMRRRVIQLTSEATARAFQDEESCNEIIETLQLELLKITQIQKGRGFRPASEYVEKAYREMDEISHKRIAVSGLDACFRDLNRLTQGMHAQQLIIVAGRPGHGKTSIAQNMVDHLVIRRHKSVGVFSLEMSGQEMAKRSICAEAPVDSYDIPSGSLDWRRIGDVCESLSKSKLWIDESAGLTINELRARAQRLAVEHGLDLIVVDYLQLMAGTGRRGDNREREISEISRGLKVMAKDLNIPVIALSQLNREIEKSTRRPQLSDLRESGSLEQDADVVLFIWRDELRAKTVDNEGRAELILAKQRNGKSGLTIDLDFDKRYCRFMDR